MRDRPRSAATTIALSALLVVLAAAVGAAGGVGATQADGSVNSTTTTRSPADTTAAVQSSNATVTTTTASTAVDPTTANVSLVADGGTPTLDAASGQTIEGTSSLPAGTDVTVRLRSAADAAAPFIKVRTATVDDTGAFTATFDLSGVAYTSEATASVLVGDETVAEREVRVIGENRTTAGTTDAGAGTGSATSAAGGETTTGGDRNGGDTDRRSPGFGVLAALVAVLAAALLASRR